MAVHQAVDEISAATGDALHKIEKKPILQQILIGATSGMVTGYVLTKIGKTVAFCVGVSAIGLQFFVNRNRSADEWKKIEDDAHEILEKVVPTAKQNKAYSKKGGWVASQVGVGAHGRWRFRALLSLAARIRNGGLGVLSPDHPRIGRTRDQRYKCKAPCCSGFSYSLGAPCTLCGRLISVSGSSESSQVVSERHHVEQVGTKRRLIEISVSISDSPCTFPLAVVSLGKTSVFDAKENLCTITSKSISFGANVHGSLPYNELFLGVFVPLAVKADEVEEILFCEQLKVIFLILNITSMNRISESLGVTHHCKDDKKRRVVIVLEEKSLRNPFDCSVIPRCLTSPQLEAFCTNVRLMGGVSMTDVKPSTAQSILVAFGLRLTRSHPNETTREVSTVNLSGNALSDCPVVRRSSNMPLALHPSGAGDSDNLVVLSDDESDCENDDNNGASSNVTHEPTSADEVTSINGKGSFVYHPPGSKDGILLTEADVDCLSPGVFLNDTIINFYLKYLYFEQFSPLQRHATHLFNSFFYSRLCSAHCDISLNPESADEDLRMSRHAAVANWTRRVDIFTKDYIIIPINENLHWFLGLVCYPWMVGMVSYTKLYADYSFDQCRLIPDFADTNNVEASFSDIGIEEVKALPTDERGEAFDRWRRRRLAWLRGRGINAMPCILLFDSISAQQRIGNLHIIRNYLQAEWDVRRKERDGDMLFNKDTVRGFSPRVPGQSNLVDCGIFLLHYVEMFFKRPLKSYTREFFQNEMSRWFESEMLGKKRSVISKLIEQISRRPSKSDQNPYKRPIPMQ
ncbi:unnamed protein product [Hydatigera taeniaeformis]|uniref:ULP_PROTEASE domain-containing protein n=1 Tax=Hydatigena taeniaeformis TaxID=6205 RepID=A0A0R3WL90_HYDTA|nr:unnamed protein product [Hydatigera taeniaeformis]